MKLEIFGSLFAALFSLFVTVEHNLLMSSSQANVGFYAQEEDRQELPLSISRDFAISRYRNIDTSRRESESVVENGGNIVQNPPLINVQSAWVGCLCDEAPLFVNASANQLPLASVSKIMTAYLALRELGPDYSVEVSSEAIATEGIAGNLQAGETFALKDLITMMMTSSSNDAAMAVAHALGRAHNVSLFEDAIAYTVSLMNEEALKLGMRNTMFQNPTGLDLLRVESRGLPGGPSNFSTAHDIVMLLHATRVTPLLWDLSRGEDPVVSKEGITHELFNRNPFRTFPHYVGGKTGTTDFAGENLVMLFEKPLGKPHALIIFGAPPGAREAETKKLLDWINRI